MSDERIRVVGIGGTLREGSVSLGALRRALGASEVAGAEVELLDLRKLDLPMYEPGRRLEEYGENVRRLVEAMWGADEEGNVIDDGYGARLEKLGRLVVVLAEGLSPERRATDVPSVRPAPIGIAI